MPMLPGSNSKTVCGMRLQYDRPHRRSKGGGRGAARRRVGDSRRPPAPRDTAHSADVVESVNRSCSSAGVTRARRSARGIGHALLNLYVGMLVSDALVAPGMTIRFFSTLS